jgi:hypothetical protein
MPGCEIVFFSVLVMLHTGPSVPNYDDFYPVNFP